MMYYDLRGKPIDLLTWMMLFEDFERRLIACHYVRGWKVFTIWEGLDHSFGRSHAPLIFETMIFPPADETEDRSARAFDEYCERYPTPEAAQAGHDRALAWLIEQLGDDAANDIISAAQFEDPMVVPDDPGELT